MGNVSLRYSSYDHDSQHPPHLNWGSVSLLIHKLHWVYVSVLIVDDYGAGQIPGMPQSMPGVFPGMFPFGGTQFGGMPAMPAQAMTQQATRHARRVYVGGLPPIANEQTIATFFSQVMAAVGGNTAGPGMCIFHIPVLVCCLAIVVARVFFFLHVSFVFVPFM